MSARGAALRTLITEGANDQFVAIETIKKLRPLWDADATRWGGGFKAVGARGDADALETFGTALLGGPRARVGLVLDADDTAGKRVADRVALLQRKFPEIGVPTLFPAAGWINVAHSPRCGVWFMPDNQRDGALEAFIAPFIPAGDSSIAYAEQCARDARTAHGAPYEAKDASKARLHTWLAWRAEPGRPYGRAIAAGDLAPLRDATAQSFADWFEALFIR